MMGGLTVAVLVLFGVILLACAAEVVRLARDARADADSEQDVFERRRQSRLAAVRRVRTLVHDFRSRRASARQTAPAAAAATPVVRPEAATVRITPARRAERDYPTIPAMSR
jgi:hypothetical protein